MKDLTDRNEPVSADRREYLRLLRNLGIGAVAAGSGLFNAGRAMAQAGAVEDNLVFMFSGGLNQGVIEKDFFAPFSKTSGVKTLTFVGGNTADNLAKVRAQGANPASDVIYLSGSSSYTGLNEGLVQAFDPAQIPNLSKVDVPAGKDPRLLPFSLTHACLIYNTKVFAEKGFKPPTSWEDLWDPKYKGHVGTYSAVANPGLALIVAAAQLTGDPNNIDAGIKKIATLKGSVVDFYTAGGPYEAAFNSGEVWIGVNSTTRAFQMEAEGWAVGTVLPKEGAVGWPGDLGMIKGAPHPKAAHAWANYMLSTEGQTLVKTKLGLTPVNREVKISDAEKKFFPPPANTIMPDWKAISGDIRNIVNRWNREIER